jgi:hypothetical protein
MSRGAAVRVVATVVVVVFGLGIWLTGGKPDLGWLRFFSAAVLAATAFLWLWETVAWKLPIAQQFDSVPRDVSGTWKGLLESFWTDPATGQRIAPKTVYLVVRQTASTVKVILLTDESKSVSSLGIVSGTDGVASLDYMYLNRPDAKVEHRSRMHHGSTSLDIAGRPATRLRGRYWTDRDTRGELDFPERRGEKVETLRDAEALFQA